MLKFGTSACDVVRLWSYSLYVSIEIIGNHYLAAPTRSPGKKGCLSQSELSISASLPPFHSNTHWKQIIQREHYTLLKTQIGRRQSVGYFFLRGFEFMI